MKASKRASQLVFGLCALLASLPLIADTKIKICASSSLDYLEEITVTGSRTDKAVMASPLSLSVVTAQEIQQSTANLAAELLRDIPGVQLSDRGQPRLMRIRIRGEGTEVFVEEEERSTFPLIGFRISVP